MDNSVIVATTTAAVAAAAFALAYRRRQQKIRREKKTVVPLLPGETSQIIFGFAPSISTVTFFTGDHQKAAAHLQTRVAKIVRANPWLGGWLDQQRGDASPVLVYDETGEDCTQTFVHAAPGAVNVLCVLWEWTHTRHDREARFLLLSSYC